MPIYQSGAINTTALTVPDLYVGINPPPLAINGVPSNKVGIVGTATWGPVGTPVICGSTTAYTNYFGPIQNRKYDAGTPLATAQQNGGNNFLVVRSTDGTDTAAAYAYTSTGTQMTVTARYTGTLGNSIQVTIGTGSRGSGYYKLTVSIGYNVPTMPLQTPEVFDNLAYGLSGAAIWTAFANALNNGISVNRGPSKTVVATAGTSTVAPTLGTSTLAGGTDGASNPTAVNSNPAIIYGVDVAPRTGMYALRGALCSVCVVADMDTPAAWTTIDGFGSTEAVYMIQTGPAGDNITNAVSTMQGVGLTSYFSKMMFGDWVWWLDGVNGIKRFVSPQGFIAGSLAGQAPNQTSLNKPLNGVIGTQKSGATGSQQAQSYAQADLSALFSANICVIGNPSPGGSYWSDLLGHNTSTNAGTASDQYTRMVLYVATTLNAALGKYVGQPITSGLFQAITATQNQYLASLLQQGYLSLNPADGSLPYLVTCGPSNNPQGRTSIGYVQSDSLITLQGINEKFLVNLTMGAGVVTQSVSPVLTP